MTEMVSILSKILCCMFLFAILWVEPGKIQKVVVRVLIELINRRIAIMQSGLVGEHKTKHVQGQWPSKNTS